MFSSLSPPFLSPLHVFEVSCPLSYPILFVKIPNLKQGFAINALRFFTPDLTIWEPADRLKRRPRCLQRITTGIFKLRWDTIHLIPSLKRACGQKRSLLFGRWDKCHSDGLSQLVIESRLQNNGIFRGKMG